MSIIIIETNANDEQLAKAKLCIERILKHISGSQSKYKFKVELLNDIENGHFVFVENKHEDFW